MRLVSAGLAKGGSTIWAALEFRMEAGWKIYWRTPGPAGRPPLPDWSASQGVEVGALVWPRPQIFAFSGIETVGYGRRVLLPVQATIVRGKGETPAGPRSLAVNVRYQTCKHICIPVQVRLTLAGKALAQPDTQVETDIAAARAARPHTLPTAVAQRVPDGRWRLVVHRPAGLRWRAPKLVIEAGPKSRIGLRPSKITSTGLIFDIAQPPLSSGEAKFRFLLVDGDWAGAGNLVFH